MAELESLRHDAIRILSGAVASDRLSVEQFESRLALVRQAPNRATLDAIIADVVPSGGYPTAPRFVPAVPDHAAFAPVEPAELLRIRTVLSSSKRAGSWTVPLRLEAKVMLGELTIDLRDAVFCSDVLDLELDALLGSFTLIVPAGAQVENECEERWSSTTHSTRSTRGGEPIGLLIRLTGRVRWSNVEIKEKRRSGEEEPRGLKRLLGG
jgi:hypothetical protein